MDKKFLPLLIAGIIMAIAAVIIADHFIKRYEPGHVSPRPAGELPSVVTSQPASDKRPPQAQAETESEPPATAGAPLLR